MSTNGKPDIIAVLKHYGVDAHPGRVEQLALCVSHSEDQPSMSVNTNKGLVNCHACGFRGDGWTIIMLKEGVTYAAARTIGEDRFGAVPQGEPARTSRPGLSGGSGPARGGYRPSFRGGSRRGLRDSAS